MKNTKHPLNGKKEERFKPEKITYLAKQKCYEKVSHKGLKIQQDVQFIFVSEKENILKRLHKILDK